MQAGSCAAVDCLAAYSIVVYPEKNEKSMLWKLRQGPGVRQ